MELDELKPGDRVRRTDCSVEYFQRFPIVEFGTYLRDAIASSCWSSKQEEGYLVAYVHFDGNKNPQYIHPRFLHRTSLKAGEGRMVLNDNYFIEVAEVPIKARNQTDKSLAITLPDIVVKRLGLTSKMKMSILLTYESKKFVVMSAVPVEVEHE